MKKTATMIIAILAIITSQSLAQEPQEQKVAAPSYMERLRQKKQLEQKAITQSKQNKQQALLEQRSKSDTSRPKQRTVNSDTSKYDKMNKKQLQVELKRLQKVVSSTERDYTQSQKDESETKKAYSSASEEQKPDALISMLEAEVKHRWINTRWNQVRSDLRLAKFAYSDLLYAELEQSSPKGN